MQVATYRYPGCLDNMLGQWFSSCGRQTYMEMPNMSQIVWAYTMTPTPSGVGHMHLISPRCLEEM